jgi:hypothetical protein
MSSRILASVCGCALLLGCASAGTQPPGAPPSPKSISKETPGGDAHDPHQAALLRQLEMPFGFGMDKDHQLRVPMPDPRNQKRVRYWAIEHFTGFRYGSDYHVMNVVLVQDVPDGSKEDTHSCLQRVDKWAFPQLKSYEVKLGAPTLTEVEWEGKPITVKSVDGQFAFGLEQREFSAAYAAYPAYPDACLVFGIAVPWRDQEELAKKVRDRWVHEAVSRLKPLTPTRPYRKED